MVTRLIIHGRRVIGVDFTRPGGRHEMWLRRGDPVRRRLQLAAAAPALGDRRRRTPARVGSTCATTSRAWPSTCRITSRSTSSTPARSRCPSTRVAMAVAMDRPAVAGPARARRVEPLRGRRVHAQQRRRRVSEPDVPLPAHRRRYDGSAPAGGHGYQVHVGPMYSDAGGRSASRRAIRGPNRRCASTTCRRRRTGGSGWKRSVTPAGSSASRRSPRSTAASCLRARRSRPTTRSCLGRQGRGDGAAPFVHLPDGVDELSVLDPATMRVHGLRGLRVVDASVVAVRDQRQHLCARDDGGREGGRPDPRQRPAAGRAGRVLPVG